METIKDENLSLSSRVYQVRGSHRMAVSALAAFGFGRDGAPPAFLPEAEVWGLAAPVMAEGLALEEGFAKPGKEFFVQGSAHAGPGAKAAAVEVEARVGELARKIRVAGDRDWKAAGPGEPMPFVSMPIDWSHAWGGPDSPDNPLGKGMRKNSKTGVYPLPNSFSPDTLPAGPEKPGVPATFLPVGPDWPVRGQRPVTRDKEWLAAGGPGLPPDFDRSWFMTADPEQRGAGRFKPGERFSITGMHPEKERLDGSIPTDMPWVRVERLSADGVTPVMVPLALDTVWLFPEQEKGVLVWHGEVDASDDEASDVLCLRGGFGQPGAELAVPPVESAAAPPPPPPPAAPPPLPLPLPVPVESAVAVEVPAVAAASVDVPVELVASSEPPPLKLTRAEHEKKAVEDFRAQLHDMINEMETDPDMREGGEELEIANEILLAKGYQTVSEADYQARLAERAASYHDLVDSIPDDLILRNLPAEQVYGELDEAGARELLAAKFADAGISPEDSEMLLASLFEPLEIDDSQPLSAVMEQMGFDLEALGLDPAVLDDPLSTQPSDEEKVAKANAALIEHLGKDLESLLRDDEPTGAPPETLEDFTNSIDDPELRAQIEPLLHLLFAESETEVEEIKKQVNPEDEELKRRIVAKFAPPEEQPPPGVEPAEKEEKAADPSPEAKPFDKTLVAEEPEVAEKRMVEPLEKKSEKKETLPENDPREKKEPGLPKDKPGSNAETPLPPDHLPPPEDIFGDASR